MLGAYASVAVLCAASLVVGQAVLSLCGYKERTWLSGPVGLATLLIAGGIAIKLLGHGTTVAITLAALLLFSLAAVVLRGRVSGAGPEDIRSISETAPAPRGAVRRRANTPARTVRCMDAKRPPGAHPALALMAAGLALLIASIPFIASGRVGILGVGLVNDDMASHLLIADWLNTRVGQMPALVHQGYPVGPHALAAGLSQGLGTGLIEAFAGLTLAIPVLTALVAFEALDSLARARRVVAAALVAVPYLVAAYLAQEAFKEPIEALFVLSFALLLPQATTARRAIPLGVIAAGAVYTYSFPGLFWLAGTATIWGVIVVWREHRGPTRIAPGMSRHGDVADIRGRLPVRPPTPLLIAIPVVALLVLTAPEWGRIVDFSHFRAFRESTISSGLGNLRHQLSPLEALGIWPASDFRLSASDASGPTVAFYLGAMVAAAALALGLPRWIRWHGAAIPCAMAACVAIYVGALAFGTVYTSAKALAIAAPLISLISFGGLLEGERRSGQVGEAAGGSHAEAARTGAGGVPAAGGVPGAGPEDIRSRTARTVRCMDAKRPPGAHPVLLLLAAALAAGIALSSLLVLRQAPVAPTDHADQLAELRPLVEGRRLLFLGRDNFVSYELRGARPFTAVRNYYDPNYVKPNLRLADVFRKFDFDSVREQDLRSFPFVITTRAAYASGPPPGFEPLRKTTNFVLWRRTGPIGARRTLAEGANPGAVLDCTGDRGRTVREEGGTGTVFRRPPVAGGTWSPGSTVENGSPVNQSLTLPQGSWEISIEYDATRPLAVRAPGLDATLPANLDYRGSVPFYPVGKLEVPQRGPVEFTVSVEEPPLAGRLLGTKSEAHLSAIAASPAAPSGGPIPGEAERRFDLRKACGRYLDWYRPPAGG